MLYFILGVLVGIFFILSFKDVRICTDRECKKRSKERNKEMKWEA